jgi:leucyl-tRNA synthetase
MVKRVTDDIGNLRMNKAISALMEWTNALQRSPAVSIEHLSTLALLVSPIAPHLGEELGSRLFGLEHARAGSVIAMPWPTFDPGQTVEHLVKVPVQVNTKIRAVIEVEVAVDEDSLVRLAKDAVSAQLAGQYIVRTIVKMDPVPQIVSFVAREGMDQPS